MPFVFVTSNKGKAYEAEAILGRKLEIISVDLDEIQSMDLEKIVRQKAIAAFEGVLGFATFGVLIAPDPPLSRRQHEMSQAGRLRQKQISRRRIP